MWLETCMKEHKGCSAQGLFPRTGLKRLLVLLKDREQTFLHLLEVTSDDGWMDYLTLSHCWGKIPMLTLRHENHNRYLEDIPITELPKTFQDAVDITLRALWIDALCIIQDDAADWEAEAPNMGTIYGNSVCTIAALSASGSSGGCYILRLPLSNIPCRIRAKNGTTVYFRSKILRGMQWIINPNSSMRKANAPPLHKRGWVVQERTLSPRTLYFGTLGISWECCLLNRRESSGRASAVNYDSDRDSLKKGLGWVPRRPPGKESIKNRRMVKNDLTGGIIYLYPGMKGIPMTATSKLTRDHWHHHWWQLVEIYTRCDLTKMSDRWPAISGIAQIVKLAAKSSLVGAMWQVCIPQDMLWRTIKPAIRLNNGQPSWSWVSTDGAVELPTLQELQYTSEVMTLPCEIEYRDLPKEARENNGEAKVHLTIQAPLIKCGLRKTEEIDERSKALSGISRKVWVRGNRLSEEIPRLIEEEK